MYRNSPTGRRLLASLSGSSYDTIQLRSRLASLRASGLDRTQTSPRGAIVPSDWKAIVLGPVMVVRWPHMLLAAFLTTAMWVIATGAWYLLRGVHRDERRVMLHWGLGLAAVLVPVQLWFGHLCGLYVYQHQPAKFVAIEARWHNEQPGSEVWLDRPDSRERRNLFAIETPAIGSFIATGTWDAPMQGLADFPAEDRPPVVIPFFGFRIMVGMGLLMVAIAWGGLALRLAGQMEKARWFLWAAYLSFPSGFAATLAGWYTAEVGRQPWVVYGLLRTSDAVTPALNTGDVLISLAVYGVVYTICIGFGITYIYRLLRDGPGPARQVPDATPSRPLAFAEGSRSGRGS